MSLIKSFLTKSLFGQKLNSVELWSSQVEELINPAWLTCNNICNYYYCWLSTTFKQQ